MLELYRNVLLVFRKHCEVYPHILTHSLSGLLGHYYIHYCVERKIHIVSLTRALFPGHID